MITLDTLQAICPSTRASKLELYVDPLNAAMAEYSIDWTPVREAAFLAQIAHESGSFNYVRELASGEAYEGRDDLGNTESGDGRRFKGRGLIQITGRANYNTCGQALSLPLLDSPELLEEPVNAARSAAWFWDSRHLNELADRGDFKTITRKINGGLTHYAERVELWERAQGALT